LDMILASGAAEREAVLVTVLKCLVSGYASGSG